MMIDAIRSLRASWLCKNKLIFLKLMLRLKDYYKILKVSPTASLDDIKKSFRKMALELHPDKTYGDKYKEALFTEVQEAYETLSDPSRRQEYNYKRWATRNFGKLYEEEALTPNAILFETKKLEDHIKNLNVFQLDFDALSFHMRHILSSRNIEILHQFSDQRINTTIVDRMLKMLNPLPFRYTEPIALLLSRLAIADAAKIEEIEQYIRHRRNRHFWDRYRGFIVIVVTIIICLLMYWFTR